MTRKPDRDMMKEEAWIVCVFGDQKGKGRVTVGVMFQRVAIDGSHGTRKHVQELECCWTWLAQKREAFVLDSWESTASRRGRRNGRCSRQDFANPSVEWKSQ